MTKVAIWCREKTENLIGVGKEIPWNVPSDSRFFADVIAEQNVVFGRKTFETIPKQVLEKCEVWVLSSLRPEDEQMPKNEHWLSDIRHFKEFEEDLYIGGGAQVYDAFVNGAPKLMPDIIVDCVYLGEINSKLEGEKITITPCVETMHKKYFKITDDFEKDGVCAALWVKKGDFVEQSVLKRLLLLLENR